MINYTVDGVLKKLHLSGDIKPKKMVFELSEDGKFYHTKFYNDFVTSKGTFEGYVECHTNIPSFVNQFNVLPYEDRDEETIFTIIIPEDCDT